jgi:hypothetical protein
MIVRTETGSTYEFDPANHRVRRINPDGVLRGDGEWLRRQDENPIHIGSPMLLVLEPLDADADATLRLTTPVVSIEDKEPIILPLSCVEEPNQ